MMLHRKQECVEMTKEEAKVVDAFLRELVQEIVEVRR
jgi:hypothetical protein